MSSNSASPYPSLAATPITSIVAEAQTGQKETDGSSSLIRLHGISSVPELFTLISDMLRAEAVAEEAAGTMPEESSSFSDDRSSSSCLPSSGIPVIPVGSNTEKQLKLMLNHIDRNGKAPLHYAARNGRIQMIDLLLSLSGSNINIQDEDGRTALYYAARGGHTSAVERLLSVEADANILDFKQQRSALHVAAEEGCLGVVRALLRCPLIDYQSIDRVGSTPLHCASEYGHFDIVSEILAHSERIHNDRHGSHPRHNLNRNGNRAMEEKEGADEKKQQGEERGNADRGKLDDAIGGEADYESQSDTNHHLSSRTTTTADETGISLDHESQSTEELMDRIKRRASSSPSSLSPQTVALVNRGDHNGITPLHCAARGGFAEVARILLSYGAKVDPRDVDGYTPLLNAVSPLRSVEDVVLLLINDHDADVNATINDGYFTPIHFVCCSPRPSLRVLMALVDKGADVCSVGGIVSYGLRAQTPLYLAVSRGHSIVAAVLLSAGADLYPRRRFAVKTEEELADKSSTSLEGRDTGGTHIKAPASARLEFHDSVFAGFDSAVARLYGAKQCAGDGDTIASEKPHINYVAPSSIEPTPISCQVPPPMVRSNTSDLSTRNQREELRSNVSDGSDDDVNNHNESNQHNRGGHDADDALLWGDDDDNNERLTREGSALFWVLREEGWSPEL